MSEIPSKEIMERDIENTKKEIGAYEKILEAYRVLKSLPETSPSAYVVEIMKYESYLSRGKKFLETLEKLYRKYYGMGKEQK